MNMRCKPINDMIKCSLVRLQHGGGILDRPPNSVMSSWKCWHPHSRFDQERGKNTKDTNWGKKKFKTLLIIVWMVSLRVFIHYSWSFENFSWLICTWVKKLIKKYLKYSKNIFLKNNIHCSLLKSLKQVKQLKFKLRLTPASVEI